MLILLIDGWVISPENALRWMSFDLTDDKPTLAYVDLWHHMSTQTWIKIGPGNGFQPGKFGGYVFDMKLENMHIWYLKISIAMWF